MSQQIRLAGWSDPEHPGVQKEAGMHEFRLKLSESPAPPWKRLFAELSRDQTPMASIDQDRLALSCELQDIEKAVVQLKQRLSTVNETIDRRDRETDERAERQQVDNEQRRMRVLTAVKNIAFDEI